MGGSNPYIEQVKYSPATKKFKVTFVREGKTVEVDPEKVSRTRGRAFREASLISPRDFTWGSITRVAGFARAPRAT